MKKRMVRARKTVVALLRRCIDVIGVEDESLQSSTEDSRAQTFADYLIAEAGIQFEGEEAIYAELLRTALMRAYVDCSDALQVPNEILQDVNLKPMVDAGLDRDEVVQVWRRLYAVCLQAVRRQPIDPTVSLRQMYSGRVTRVESGGVYTDIEELEGQLIRVADLSSSRIAVAEKVLVARSTTILGTEHLVAL